MNSNHLAYFKKLAEVENYTRAARELFIAQSTLSGAVAALEKELNAPLFERKGRRVELTPQGEIFYEYACLALRAIDDGKAAVAEKSDSLSGSINLGTIYTVQDDYLPSLLKAYRDSRSQFSDIKVTQGFTNYLLEQVENGNLQAAFCGKSKTSQDIVYVPATQYALVLYVHTDSMFARRKKVSFSELVDFPIVTYREHIPIGDQVHKLLENYDLNFVERLFDDDMSMASFLSYDSRDIGALMLDSLGARLFTSLHKVQIAEIPDDFYQVYLAYNKKHHLSRAAQDFIDFVVEYSVSQSSEK